MLVSAQEILIKCQVSLLMAVPRSLPRTTAPVRNRIVSSKMRSVSLNRSLELSVACDAWADPGLCAAYLSSVVHLERTGWAPSSQQHLLLIPFFPPE